MIIVTGALTHFGSRFIEKLRHENFINIIQVDDFERIQPEIVKDLTRLGGTCSWGSFSEWLSLNAELVEFVFHLGECPQDIPANPSENHFNENLWKTCSSMQIPLIYLSSEATYGNGDLGYSDSHEQLSSLIPSPNGLKFARFDLWAIEQMHAPFFWAGIKLLDSRLDAFRKIQETGLYTGNSETATDLLYQMMHHRKKPGIFNIPVSIET